jgi:hypothetical protein
MKNDRFRLASYNLRWDVHLDYETYRPCQNGSNCCDNDYCRCGIIRDARVANASTGKILDLFGEELDVWDRYCIDRVLSNAGAWDSDNYRIETCRGYYGEEFDGIYFRGAGDVDAKVDQILSASRTDKINLVLTEEYGYLIETLVDKQYEVVEVRKDQVVFGQEDHYRRLKPEVIESYRDYDLPRGVVVESEGRFRVIDGYHRIAAAPATFEVILAR